MSVVSSHVPGLDDAMMSDAAVAKAAENAAHSTAMRKQAQAELLKRKLAEAETKAELAASMAAKHKRDREAKQASDNRPPHDTGSQQPASVINLQELVSVQRPGGPVMNITRELALQLGYQDFIIPKSGSLPAAGGVSPGTNSASSSPSEAVQKSAGPWQDSNSVASSSRAPAEWIGASNAVSPRSSSHGRRKDERPKSPPPGDIAPLPSGWTPPPSPRVTTRLGATEMTQVSPAPVGIPVPKWAPTLQATSVSRVQPGGAAADADSDRPPGAWTPRSQNDINAMAAFGNPYAPGGNLSYGSLNRDDPAKAMAPPPPPSRGAGRGRGRGKGSSSADIFVPKPVSLAWPNTAKAGESVKKRPSAPPSPSRSSSADPPNPKRQKTEHRARWANAVPAAGDPTPSQGTGSPRGGAASSSSQSPPTAVKSKVEVPVNKSMPKAKPKAKEKAQPGDVKENELRYEPIPPVKRSGFNYNATAREFRMDCGFVRDAHNVLDTKEFKQSTCCDFQSFNFIEVCRYCFDRPGDDSSETPSPEAVRDFLDHNFEVKGELHFPKEEAHIDLINKGICLQEVHSCSYENLLRLQSAMVVPVKKIPFASFDSFMASLSASTVRGQNPVFG